VVPLAEERKEDDSAGGLPVFSWVRPATEREETPPDWTRDLLRNRHGAGTG
jgi:hypothetical protein